MTNEGLI